jgi:hypothetical protein
MAFLGGNDKRSCKAKYVFSNACIGHIIQYYNKKYNGRFKRVFGLSNGCKEQFKSSYTAYEMTHFCEMFKIDEYNHTFAPTAQIKCCCDSAGNDTKTFTRGSEHDGTIWRGLPVRSTDAWEVFEFLDEVMSKAPRRSQAVPSYCKTSAICL